MQDLLEIYFIPEISNMIRSYDDFQTELMIAILNNDLVRIEEILTMRNPESKLDNSICISRQTIDPVKLGSIFHYLFAEKNVSILNIFIKNIDFFHMYIEQDIFSTMYQYSTTIEFWNILTHISKRKYTIQFFNKICRLSLYYGRYDIVSYLLTTNLTNHLIDHNDMIIMLLYNLVNRQWTQFILLSMNFLIRFVQYLYIA